MAEKVVKIARDALALGDFGETLDLVLRQPQALVGAIDLRVVRIHRADERSEEIGHTTV